MIVLKFINTEYIKGVVESFRGRLQLIFEPEGLERSTEPYNIAEYLHITSKGKEGVWSACSRRLNRFFYLGRGKK